MKVKVYTFEFSHNDKVKLAAFLFGVGVGIIPLGFFSNWYLFGLIPSFAGFFVGLWSVFDDDC